MNFQPKQLIFVVSLLAFPAAVLAEGTDELMPSVGTSGRLGLVDADVTIFADILQPTDEVICVEGLDTVGNTVTFDLTDPTGVMVETGVATDGGCVSLLGHPRGAYQLGNFSRAFTSTRRWDISVCDTTIGACDAGAANPAHVDGRVFSYRWVFNSTSTQSSERAVRASVYARVPIGRFGLGVVELQLGGVHGLARWELLGNGSGIRDVNPSRSTREGRPVDTEFPIYLSPPDPLVAPYGVPAPRVSDFTFVASGAGASCGGIEPGRNVAQFGYDSNMPGRARLICDIDGDGDFDAAGANDLVLGGEAVVGSNMIEWDGRRTAGDVPAGEYECLVELGAGEFHYVAEDIEVAYPGLRMFQVSPTRERTPLRMFWNDLEVIPAVPTVMPNDDLPETYSPEGGLSPGAYVDPALAHGMTKPGNARGWGAFSTVGSLTGSRGDGSLMDTWTSLNSVRSASVTVVVFGRAADCDGTGGPDFEEVCVAGTDPCACDADSQCNDGVECTFDSCNGTDCVYDSVPRGGECAGGVCSGGADPFCAMCLNNGDCPDGTVCTDNRCVGDDDDMDTIPNVIECPDLGAGGTCPDTDGDGTVDYLDPDDDGDGILTRDEVSDGRMFGNDVDGDGKLNWHDTDSDEDELLDGVDEGREDADEDGRPDYLDPKDPEPPVTPPVMPPILPPPDEVGGLTGGALCAVGHDGDGLVWLVPLAMWALRRRRSA